MTETSIGDKTSCPNCGKPVTVTTLVTRRTGREAHAHHDATDAFECDPAAWRRARSMSEYTGGFAAWPLT